MQKRSKLRVRAESGTLTVELALLVASLLLAAIVESFFALPNLLAEQNPNADVDRILTQTADLLKRVAGDVIMLGLLFYIATQLVRVLWFMITVGELLSDHQDTLKDATLSNEIHNSLTQTVLKIFEHQDDYMRASVISALDKFLETIKIERSKIELKSDYIAAEVYVSFWRELLRKQTELRGLSKSIKVYVCHSASLGIWESGDLLASTQADFCGSAGTVCRILVRNAHSTDQPIDYDRVARRMNDIGIKTFYFDAGAQKQAVHDDFLMCQVDDDFYVLVWNADWGATPRFGDINGCTLLVGQENYAVYTNKWKNLLRDLRDADQAPPADCPNLNTRPTETELTELGVNPAQRRGEGAVG